MRPTSYPADLDGPEERSVWQTTARLDALGLPTATGEIDTEVCVVGLGGSGLTLVLELAESGVDVVGLDARTVAAGAAGRNGGLLLAGAKDFYHDARTRMGNERALALYRATEDERARIAARTPNAVRATGSLRVAATEREEADLELQLAAMREDGLEVERATTPWGPALRFPGDLCFHPLERARTLAADAIRAGAHLFERTPARTIEGERVETDDALVRAKHVVVTVDGGLEHLFPELSGEVRTARLQMLATAPGATFACEAPIYVRDGYEYVHPLADGRIAVGGYRDRFEDDEWTIDDRPTPAVQAEIEHFLRSTLRVDAPVTERWAASVGYSRGPLPVFREVRPGVLVCGGYSGTGNIIGALCARAAADRVRGHRTPLVELFEAPV